MPNLLAMAKLMDAAQKVTKTDVSIHLNEEYGADVFRAWWLAEGALLFAMWSSSVDAPVIDMKEE